MPDSMVDEQATLDAINNSITVNARVRRDRENELRIKNLERMVKENHDILVRIDNKLKVAK